MHSDVLPLALTHCHPSALGPFSRLLRSPVAVLLLLVLVAVLDPHWR
jgi:hypothetical protein